MSADLLRVYFDPAEIGPDGYPYVWHGGTFRAVEGVRLTSGGIPAVKDLIREQAGNRCERCKHPYTKGQGLNGGWSRCEVGCTHRGPVRIRDAGRADEWREFEEIPNGETAGEGIMDYMGPGEVGQRWEVEARWRILTVHHLNGVKHDLRWWNLAALCQRCHLTIQGKVYLERPWIGEHSEWFKPHAAGWYAWSFLGLDVSREETMERLDEFLALEHRQLTIQ